jgi:HAD superfamily hydrolase (TIGR01549 family)
MKTLAIIFDAFGTLVKMQPGAHPYRRILKLGIEQGRRPKDNDAEIILSNRLDLRDFAKYLEVYIPPEMMIKLESDLTTELLQLEAYEDGIHAINVLQNAGVNLCICSNLAYPYASAIERLYPSVTHRSYSFEVGTTKPNFLIYEHAANSLNMNPEEIWMIGDSIRCDKQGPDNFGIRGFHLSRDGGGDYKNLTDFTKDFLYAYFHD